MTLTQNNLRDEADRLEAAWKREKAAIENSSAVGNAAAMRKALKEMIDWADAALKHHPNVYIADALKQIKVFGETALSAPPRNCDVGTVTEQYKRHCR